MPDILQDFPIKAPPDRVFAAVSEPAGLDQWWTITASGAPALGAEYELDFGPDYRWRAVVTKCERDRAFELRLTHADGDWTSSVVGFELCPNEDGTHVAFYHRGWSEANAHYRTSCHCWALYLRILRRYLEFGETVPYEQRLDV